MVHVFLVRMQYEQGLGLASGRVRDKFRLMGKNSHLDQQDLSEAARRRLSWTCDTDRTSVGASWLEM